jgi:hypothetical protein
MKFDWLPTRRFAGLGVWFRYRCNPAYWLHRNVTVIVHGMETANTETKNLGAKRGVKRSVKIHVHDITSAILRNKSYLPPYLV